MFQSGKDFFWEIGGKKVEKSRRNGKKENLLEKLEKVGQVEKTSFWGNWKQKWEEVFLENF